ncbi:LysR substrate-binding domain-containing protein [Paraburkholderia caffeinilytica]
MTLCGIVNESWILHAPGSVLRPHFDLMFSQIGLNPSQNVVNTNNFLTISSLLLQGDMLAVLPDEVAGQYQQYGVQKQVLTDLPCRMDTFGIITRQSHLLSPAAFGCSRPCGKPLSGLWHGVRTGSGAINASPVAIAAIAADVRLGRDTRCTTNTENGNAPSTILFLFAPVERAPGLVTAWLSNQRFTKRNCRSPTWTGTITPTIP